MRGSYLAVSPSNSLLGYYNPMEMRQDDHCPPQSLLMDDHLSYVDAQHRYYDPLQGLAGHESIACSAMITAEPQQHAEHPFNIDYSTDVIQSNDSRDAWRYHEDQESQESNFGLGCQTSPPRYMNQDLAYAAQSAFEESYRMTDSSDVDASRDDVISSSTSPKMDLSPAVEGWPLVPEEPILAFHSEDGLLTRESQDDEEAPGDKPYARLIHEALMQAPDHSL